MRIKMMAAVLTTIFVFTSPFAAGSQSGLSLFGASNSNISFDEGGSVVELDSKGEILATGHDGSVSIYSFPSMVEMKSFVLRNQVVSLEFTPDSKYLIIGMKAAGSNTESLQFVKFGSEIEILERTSSISSNARAMDMHPNGDSFAISDDDMGVSIFVTEDFHKIDDLGSGHFNDVTCIDYSDDGSLILTGDKNGKIILRNLSDSEVIDTLEFSETASSCSIAADNNRILISGINGKVMIWDLASSSSISEEFGSSSIAYWSATNTKVHVLVDGSSPRMLVLSAENLDPIYETKLFHQANDMIVIENDKEIVESLVIATGTGNAAHYIRDFDRPVTSEVDTDRDGISNIEDLDADGDGIIKWWDINCESGIDCDNDPDLDRIRKISVVIDDEEFTVKDAIFFNMEQSSLIRNMSRASLIEDQVISQEEIELFTNSACANIDVEDLAEKWADQISLTSGGFSGLPVISCEVLEGMEFVSIEDYKTQILFELSIIWKLDQRPDIPYSITMTDQPELVDASITRIAPFHPSSLYLYDSNGDGESSELWWGESPIKLNVVAKEEVKPTFQDQTKSFVINNPWVAIPFLILAGMGLLVLIRKRNQIAMDGEICEVCGSINPLNSLLCKDCGALFVHDQVMSKLHRWMKKNKVTIRQMFDRFDEDGNGTLETDELIKGLRSLRIAALPISQMEALVESIDIDGNGVIDFEEFESAIGSAKEERVEVKKEQGSDDESVDSEQVQAVNPRPKRGPPQSKRNQPKIETEPVARRRRVDSSAIVDGPITSSKRRRLDVGLPDEETAPVVRKRKVVKMGDEHELPAIRTRKVAKAPEPKKKRRKAVRRKKD